MNGGMPSPDGLNEAEAFFWDHAGYWYTQAEMPEQGRVRCARELAEAERLAAQYGATWEVEADPDPMWDDDVEREHTNYHQWWVRMCDCEGDVVASLGAIDNGPDAGADAPYIRVVKAELALEGMSHLERAWREVNEAMTCGTCGHKFPDIYPAGRCPREHEHTDEQVKDVDRVVWTVTVYDLEERAGRDLTDEEVQTIAQAIDHSSIPDALSDVVYAVVNP